MCSHQQSVQKLDPGDVGVSVDLLHILVSPIGSLEHIDIVGCCMKESILLRREGEEAIISWSGNSL